MTNFSEKLDRLKQLPNWYVITAALLVTTLVGLLDFLVGEEMDLSVLYVPTVAIVCWLVNLRVAVLLSLLCSLVWLVDNWLAPDIPLPSMIHYWETAMRFSSFLILTVVLTHLRQSLERETLLARSDALTGLANSKSFSEHANREMALSRRNNTPLTVAFLDCDHFKEVNDQFGHPRGDELLKQMADVIRGSIRGCDLAARMGGDEFALLCPNTDEKAAGLLGNRLKQNLDRTMRDGNWPVTFSLGMATFLVPPRSVADLIRESDNLMYAVKRDSRDGIRHATVKQTPSDDNHQQKTE